jgi:hypothetical protein
MSAVTSRDERQLLLQVVLPHERMLPAFLMKIAFETQLAISTALQPAVSTTSFVNTSFLAAALVELASQTCASPAWQWMPHCACSTAGGFGHSP